MRLTRRLTGTLILVVVMGLSTWTSRADLIKITDLTEGAPTVQAFKKDKDGKYTIDVTKDKIKINMKDSVGEYLHFTFKSIAMNKGKDQQVYTDLFEDQMVFQRLSDRFLLEVKQNSNIYDVKFGSDPDLKKFSIDPTTNSGLDAVENGKFQPVARILDPKGNVIDEYQVASDQFTKADADATPEPPTLFLFGLGTMGVICYAWVYSRRVG
jgi:hypothetical protein